MPCTILPAKFKCDRSIGELLVSTSNCIKSESLDLASMLFLSNTLAPINSPPSVFSTISFTMQYAASINVSIFSSTATASGFVNVTPSASNTPITVLPSISLLLFICLSVLDSLIPSSFIGCVISNTNRPSLVSTSPFLLCRLEVNIFITASCVFCLLGSMLYKFPSESVSISAKSFLAFANCCLNIVRNLRSSQFMSSDTSFSNLFIMSCIQGCVDAKRFSVLICCSQDNVPARRLCKQFIFSV